MRLKARIKLSIPDYRSNIRFPASPLNSFSSYSMQSKFAPDERRIDLGVVCNKLKISFMKRESFSSLTRGSSCLVNFEIVDQQTPAEHPTRHFLIKKPFSVQWTNFPNHFSLVIDKILRRRHNSPSRNVRQSKWAIRVRATNQRDVPLKAIIISHCRNSQSLYDATDTTTRNREGWLSILHTQRIISTPSARLKSGTIEGLKQVSENGNFSLREWKFVEKFTEWLLKSRPLHSARIEWNAFNF